MQGITEFDKLALRLIEEGNQEFIRHCCEEYLKEMEDTKKKLDESFKQLRDKCKE
jgi:hypothetical protein